MGRVWIILVLFCFLNGALVEAQVPELTLLLRGVVIPENEVLDKEDLGVYPDEAGALSVVTPYSGALSFHYPTDALVPEESVGFFWISSTETFSNGSQIIRLRRREEREQSASQEGVWRCSVPSDASGGRRNIYFGLYTRSLTDRGVLSISSAPALTAVSSLLTEPPTYTLTANTTGGPPGNVEWTIDGAAIPDSTATANIDSDSFSDRTNARYTHTLMVRGRQNGDIRFTASNRRTSPAPSRQLTITFPDAPTNVEASQVGENQVEVTWNGPANTVSGYAVVVNGQSPTMVSAQPLSHSVALPPGSHSGISVASLSTVQGEQLYSTSTSVTGAVTVLALPTPSISSTSALTSTSVRVDWTLSSGSGNESPDDFIITYTRTSCPPEDADSVTVDGSLRTRDIDGLEEFSTYTVRMTAVYRFGGSNQPVMKESDEMNVQTLSAAPTGAPQGLSIQNVMATSVVLSWDELDCLERNGDITGYMIRYVGNSQTITNSSSDTSTTYTIQGLDPFTEYLLAVAAMNSNDVGPFSGQPLTVTTPESTPGEVDSLTITPKFTSVEVTWSAPVRPNGIITKYEVTYTINSVTKVNMTDNTTLEFTISSLDPGTNVNITVRAFTRIGAGEVVTLTSSTLEAPPPVNNVQVEDIDGTSVRVTWEPLDIPEITGYRVYYSLSESRKRQSGGFKDVEGREMSSTVVDGLQNGITYSFSVVSLASLDGEDPIVGEIMSGVTHVVRPPCGTTGTGGSSCPTLDTTTLTPRCQYVGAVIGAVFATILLYTVILLIVLLVCFYWRKQQSTYSVQVKSEQQQREQPDQEGRIYDVIEPADKGIPMKQCAAYGDVHTRQRTGDPQDVGIYDNDPI